MDKSDKPAEDKPEAKKEEEPVEQGKEEIKEEDLVRRRGRRTGHTMRPPTGL